MTTPRHHLATVLGETYLIAMGAAALLLLALSIAGIPWSRGALLIGMLVLAVIALLRTKASIYVPPLSWWNLVDLVTVALIAGYARLALAAPPLENDYLLIWGVKAKGFFFARAIDWSYLEAPLNIDSHPDYPLLSPFVFDVHALIAGGWNDRWLGIVNVMFGIAALLVVRGLLYDEVATPMRVIASAVLMPLVFSPYIGLAEGPLIAFALAGLLRIRRGDTIRGAVFLGFAAFTKNEGLALIAAVAVALMLAKRWRELPKLGPAIAIALPWHLLRSLHELPAVDLVQSGMVARLFARLADPSPILAAMKRHPVGSLWFWLGVVLACLIGFRDVIGRERFLTVAILVQLVFFVGAFFVSPKDLDWHVQWAWERIVRQMMPALALLAMLVLPFHPREEKAELEA
jgi:hypothetical protein